LSCAKAAFVTSGIATLKTALFGVGRTKGFGAALSDYAA